MVLSVDKITFVAGQKVETNVTDATFSVTFYDDQDAAITGLENILFTFSGVNLYVAEIDGGSIPAVAEAVTIKVSETGSYADDIYLEADRTVEKRTF